MTLPQFSQIFVHTAKLNKNFNENVIKKKIKDIKTMAYLTILKKGLQIFYSEYIFMAATLILQLVSDKLSSL